MADQIELAVQGLGELFGCVEVVAHEARVLRKRGVQIEDATARGTFIGACSRIHISQRPPSVSWSTRLVLVNATDVNKLCLIQGILVCRPTSNRLDWFSNLSLTVQGCGSKHAKHVLQRDGTIDAARTQILLSKSRAF
jgi:hypothetical protein